MRNSHVFGQRSKTANYLGDTVFSEDVEIYGSPTLIDSILHGGYIFDKPWIDHSTIAEYAVIAGESFVVYSFVGGLAKVTGRPMVEGSSISGGSIVADTAVVKDSFVSLNARVFGDAYVENSTITGGAIVCGNAVVIGTAIEGNTFIDRGVWNRPPLSFTCKSGFCVTESTGDLINIHCITSPARKWLKAGERYGRVLGLSEEDIREIDEYVNRIIEFKRNSGLFVLQEVCGDSKQEGVSVFKPVSPEVSP